MSTIKIIATGGTIDKLYYDAKSDYQIGEPQVEWILREAGVGFAFEIESLLRKDSLEIDAQDRARIASAVQSTAHKQILITHGTDTMVDTAQALGDVADKTVLLVGAMQPARFRDSDASFNVGFALGALHSLPPGIYIAMNGQIFSPDQVRKNRAAGRFEAL